MASNDWTLLNAARKNFPLVPVGSVSATDEKTLLVTPATLPEGVEIEIIAFYLTTETDITANDTNYWSFQVTNLTDSADLLSAAQTTKATGGTAITGNTPYVITPDQNTTLGAGKVLEMTFTKAASATTMAEVGITVEWRYKGRFEDD